MIPLGACSRKKRPSRKRIGRSFVAAKRSRISRLVPTVTGTPRPSIRFTRMNGATSTPSSVVARPSAPRKPRRRSARRRHREATASAGGAASTLVWYADVSDLISLDPAVAYEFSGVLLAHNVYETLVKFEGADLSTIKPSLAQSWDIKDSGASWGVTFKLKSGGKFASGNALSADDVVYSF